jgi:hypothetical protein
VGRSGGRPVTADGSLVVDSHAFIWYVQASPHLSDKARQVMDEATAADLPLMISAGVVGRSGGQNLDLN